MRGITHLVAGVVAGAATTILINTDSTGISCGVFIATTVGSIFPDIDNTKSMIGKRVKPISFLLNKAFGHRGFVHSPCNLICIASIVGVLLSIFGQTSYLPILLGFAIGFMLHLLLDAITKGGVPFLYPFSRKRFNFTTIKTGGIG